MQPAELDSVKLSHPSRRPGMDGVCVCRGREGGGGGPRGPRATQKGWGGGGGDREPNNPTPVEGGGRGPPPPGGPGASETGVSSGVGHREPISRPAVSFGFREATMNLQVRGHKSLSPTAGMSPGLCKLRGKAGCRRALCLSSTETS